MAKIIYMAFNLYSRLFFSSRVRLQPLKILNSTKIIILPISEVKKKINKMLNSKA